MSRINSCKLVEVPDVRDGFLEKESYHKRDLSASAPGILMHVYLDESRKAVNQKMALEFDRSWPSE